MRICLPRKRAQKRNLHNVDGDGGAAAVSGAVSGAVRSHAPPSVHAALATLFLQEELNCIYCIQLYLLYSIIFPAFTVFNYIHCISYSIIFTVLIVFTVFSYINCIHCISY